MDVESIPLLHGRAKPGLSCFFATLCIVDIFGVFPIIALPRTIVQCGWLGLPLILLVFGLQMYTASLLGKSWTIAEALDPNISRKNRYPLAAVTELTLGPRVRTCVTLLLDLTVFGGGIPNLLVASQNLQLFGLKVSADRFDVSFCYWLLIVGVLLCPIMWLGSPRDMKWLAMCSSTIVALTAILIWWCIATDDARMPVPVLPVSPSWEKFVAGYGMLAFQFDVHPTLMTVQVDMRNPKHINKAVISSFVFTGTLFGVTTGLAAWKYGGGITANVLQMVSGSIAIRIAILLAALQLCLSSAVGHSALFLHLEDQLRVQRSFGWKRCTVRSAVVFLGVALGESVPRFDIVMALIGGTLTGPLIFILPPIMYLRARALMISTRRVPTPEIFSTAERREGSEEVNDPRVHSQSVYYGIIGNKVKSNRYSNIYYDNNDDSSAEYTDADDGNSNLTMQLQKRSEPVLVDATRSLRTPRVERADNLRKTLRSGRLQKLDEYFGFCVVVLGIFITISSTYINIKNTIRFVQFTPPCILNVSAAAAGLNFRSN